MKPHRKQTLRSQQQEQEPELQKALARPSLHKFSNLNTELASFPFAAQFFLTNAKWDISFDSFARYSQPLSGTICNPLPIPPEANLRADADTHMLALLPPYSNDSATNSSLLDSGDSSLNEWTDEKLFADLGVSDEELLAELMAMDVQWPLVV